MVTDSLAKEFRRLLGADQVFLEEADRLTYAYDAAVLEPVLPALVVRPKSTELLGQVVGLCNDNNLPVTVRGAGTNLSGGTIPHPGGVVVLTNALNQIIEINEDVFVYFVFRFTVLAFIIVTASFNIIVGIILHCCVGFHFMLQN